MDGTVWVACETRHQSTVIEGKCEWECRPCQDTAKRHRHFFSGVVKMTMPEFGQGGTVGFKDQRCRMSRMCGVK
ncbi:MAG: hypothetical protein HW380_929 [Magnetococcales bacterium]|nr:hypothetical protein [Magnetococcales bacterium]